MWTMIPFVQFDALAGGALIAYYSAERTKKLFKRHIWIGLCVAWCSIWLMDNLQISTPLLEAAQHNTMIALFIGIVASLATTKQLKFSSVVFGNSVIRYIGKISYGSYIIHMFAPKFWRWLSQKDFLSQYSDWFIFGWSALFLNLAFTLILAGVSWRFIESPINRLKARFSS
jgi:peptidoglycan/LPS O-acetylase OafA/YrhL